MQRIRKQQQRIGQPRVLRGSHSSLPPTVGMSAREDAPLRNSATRRNCLRDAFAVASRGCGKWRTFGPLLAEWQIVSQHRIACLGECARENLQQRRMAVGTGAVSQREDVPIGAIGRVQYTAAAGIEGFFHKTKYTQAERLFYAVEFRRRAIPASIRRGAKRAPQIILRLRQPAMTSGLPAIMAS